MLKAVTIRLTVAAGLIFLFNVGLYPYVLDFLIIPIGSLVAIVPSIFCLTELRSHHNKVGNGLFLCLNFFFAIYPMWLLMSGSQSYSIPYGEKSSMRKEMFYRHIQPIV